MGGGSKKKGNGAEREYTWLMGQMRPASGGENVCVILVSIHHCYNNNNKQRRKKKREGGKRERLGRKWKGGGVEGVESSFGPNPSFSVSPPPLLMPLGIPVSLSLSISFSFDLV